MVTFLWSYIWNSNGIHLVYPSPVMICSDGFTPQSSVSLVTEMKTKPLKPVAKSSHAEFYRQKVIKPGNTKDWALQMAILIILISKGR